MDNLEGAATLPAKKRLKRCNFKGCKNTSNDSLIVNHGCPEHHAIMKERNTKLRIANFAKQKAILRKQFDFVSCSFLAKNAGFVKHDSYRTDVIKKAAIEKGKLIGITMAEKSPYLSLKKHGVAFLEDAIEIDNGAYDDYLKVVDSNKHNFKKLFVTLNKQGTPKYIPDKDPNRYVMGAEFCDLEQWNSILEQFQVLAIDLKLPAKGNSTKK